MEIQVSQAKFTTKLETIRCFTHGKVCTMVCTFKGCTSKTICSDCIVVHPKNHLAKILPLKEFDAQSNHVPKMIAKDLYQLRQRMTMLQNQLISSREQKKKELKTLIQDSSLILQKQLDEFSKQTLTEIEHFYEKQHQSLGYILQTTADHINQLSPYIEDTIQDSKKFDYLLDYQEKLLTIILPTLSQQTQETSTKVMSTELEVSSNHFIQVLSTLFRRALIPSAVLKEVQVSTQIDNQVYDSLESFKSKSEKQNELYKSKSQVKGLQYYKEQLKPYLHDQNEFNYGDQNVIKNSEFNPKQQIERIGSSQSQKLLPKQRESMPFEVFTSQQKHLNTVLSGHTDIVTCICILSLSKVASGGGDGLIKIWDIDTQLCVGDLHGHVGEIWDIVSIYSQMGKSQLQFSIQRDGQVYQIVSAGKDKTIKVWSFLKMVCDITLVGHLDVIKCLVSIQELDYIASAGTDQRIKIWSLKSEKAVFTIDEAHSKLIRALQYVQKKQVLLSGGGDGVMKVWSIHKGYLRDQLNHGAEIMAIKHLQDEYLMEAISIVATGGADRQIIIWNIDQGLKMKTLSGHHDNVMCLDYSLSLQFLISGGADKTIRVWDPFNQRLVKSVKAHNDMISSIKIHEERKLVISAGWDKIIRIVSIEYIIQKEKKQ